uniref:Uncharacterized protein n=1 Tax=Panagrolaimus sp. JU765 TaxID=591449 RepID=A0AC34QRA9_9BILA
MFNLRKLWEEPNKVVVRNSSNFIKPEKLNKVHKEHRLPQLLHIQLPKQFDNKIAVIAINDPRQGLDHIRLRHPEILTEKSKTPQITAEMARLALIIARTTQSIHEQRRYKKLLQTMNANLFKNYYNANIELFHLVRKLLQFVLEPKMIIIKLHQTSEITVEMGKLALIIERTTQSVKE